jgi:uncharacterized membrane protein (DUF106 family)
MKSSSPSLIPGHLDLVFIFSNVSGQGAPAQHQELAWRLSPGVAVMIKPFCDFPTIFGEKMKFFSKTIVVIIVWHNLCSFVLSQIFRRTYF